MIEQMAPAFNTLLLFVVIALLIIFLFRKNGSGSLDPADWEQRITNCCRRAIQEERAGLPFRDVRGD